MAWHIPLVYQMFGVSAHDLGEDVEGDQRGEPDRTMTRLEYELELSGPLVWLRRSDLSQPFGDELCLFVESAFLP